MKILGLPQTIGESGHRFRHNEFLIWIAETEKLSNAKLWAAVLSDRANAYWLEYRDRLQVLFEQKYLAFCDAKGYDKDEVMFDNKPDNTPAVNVSNYRQSRRENRRAFVKWDVIEIIPPAEGSQSIFNSVATSTIKQQTGEADTNFQPHQEEAEILSYEEIMKQFESEALQSAAPGRKHLDSEL